MFVSLLERRKSFEPLIDVFNQARLIIVHIHARGNVHCRDQHHTFLHSALLHNRLNLRRNVNVIAVLTGVKLEVFGVDLHASVAFLCATQCPLWFAFFLASTAETKSHREWTESLSAASPADQFPRQLLPPVASRRKVR